MSVAQQIDIQTDNSWNEILRNNQANIVLISTFIVIIIAFYLLLVRKEDKRSLIVAFILIILATIITTVFSPLKDWNSLVIAALLTPIFAYFIDFLKEKQKLSNEKDRLVWEYKCQQLEKESAVISELVGELSNHSAAFKSSYLQEIETKKWENSFKASVISELDMLSIARYYNYVLMYNKLVVRINLFIEQTKKKPDAIPESVQDLKEAFLRAETLVFFTLTYDLGLLQQKHLVRPTDEFPIHVNRLFTKYLEDCKIIKGWENVDTKEVAKKVFSGRGSKRFNKKVENEINAAFHRINVGLKQVEGSEFWDNNTSNQ